METVGGGYCSTHEYDFTYAMLAACEEVLEKVGAIVLLRTFIAHYDRTSADLHVHFLPA
jgi:hypothetical protein